MSKAKKAKKDAKLSKSGYPFDEVTSAFHKAIRLGDEEQALFWGIELYETSRTYFWKRVLIQAAEDVGLAAAEAVQQVTALAQAWELCRRWSGFYVDPQHVVMAILLLARAPKSTEVDDAKNWVIQKRKGGWRPGVPEYALDVHTEQGRQMGRTEEDW